MMVVEKITKAIAVTEFASKIVIVWLLCLLVRLRVLGYLNDISSCTKIKLLEQKKFL
jgi:hypothetical protein